MKKSLKITLIIILILLAGISAAAIWQRDNIKAFYLGMKYSSPDEISALLDDNDKIIADALKEYNAGEITELDEEQKKELESGTLTEQEAVDIVLGRKDGNGQSTGSAKGAKKDETDEKISEPDCKNVRLKSAVHFGAGGTSLVDNRGIQSIAER